MATIIGDDRDNSLFCTDRADIVEGRGGSDRLFGLGGRDRLLEDSPTLRDDARLLGDGDTMVHTTRGGDDRLDGGSGADLLYGDARVFGGGVCGADTLIGGGGDDRLGGDADPTLGDLAGVARGADRFLFARGSGRDAILDFEDGRDVVDLRGFAGIDSFAGVEAQSREVGADTVVDRVVAAGGAALGADGLKREVRLCGFCRNLPFGDWPCTNPTASSTSTSITPSSACSTPACRSRSSPNGSAAISICRRCINPSIDGYMRVHDASAPGFVRLGKVLP